MSIAFKILAIGTYRTLKSELDLIFGKPPIFPSGPLCRRISGPPVSRSSSPHPPPHHAHPIQSNRATATPREHVGRPKSDQVFPSRGFASDARGGASFVAFGVGPARWPIVPNA